MDGAKMTWALVLSGILVLSACGLAALMVRRAYRRASVPFSPWRGSVERPAGLPEELRAVEIPGRQASGVLRGWYASSRNGAAVVFLHGSNSTRTGPLDEALVLFRRGFGVLLFDLPGHGESPGSVRYGQLERQSLMAAIDWLCTRPELEPGQVGVYGFSIGGYIAAQVAPDDPRIAALALAGTPTSLQEVLRWQYRVLGPITQWPALYAFKRHGTDVTIDLRDSVRRYGGRPLLIVSAQDDDIVPVQQSRELYESAVPPKQLYVSPRARHGGYVTTDPDFQPVLETFFQRHLVRTSGSAPRPSTTTEQVPH